MPRACLRYRANSGCLILLIGDWLRETCKTRLRHSKRLTACTFTACTISVANGQLVFGVVSNVRIRKRCCIFQVPRVIYPVKRSHLLSLLRRKESSLILFHSFAWKTFFRKTFGTHFTDPMESLEDGWLVRACVYNALTIVATLLKKGKLKVAYRRFYKKAASESRYMGFRLIWKERSAEKPAKSGTGKGERTVLPGRTLGQKKSGHVPAALPTGQIRCDL